MAHGNDQYWHVPGATDRASLVPGTQVRHLGDQVQEWTDRAVRASAGRDALWYDVSLSVVPSAAGATSAYVLTLFLPSAMVGARPFMTAKILGDFPDEQIIIDIVRDSMQTLRAERADSLRNFKK